MAPGTGSAELDAADRSLVLATQDGLPLVPRPFHALAEALGMTQEEVMARFERMLERGVVRRIAAVPNHYAIGYRANGMTVWNVPDALVDDAGREVGALAFVSHCYRRPRHLPLWPYNLFAMVHGTDRTEVEGKAAQIAALLNGRQRGHEILYSKRILKKTGMRLAPSD
ncbi:MAG: siroheme decarboxylase subunit beta [Gammaproteobacteria bacterium]